MRVGDKFTMTVPVCPSRWAQMLIALRLVRQPPREVVREFMVVAECGPDQLVAPDSPKAGLDAEG